MQISFKKTYLTVICVLMVSIAGLSFLLYNHGPRVRHVSFDNNSLERAYTKDLSLQILFDRPINHADYSSAVQISPAIAFSAQTQTQSITITFRENLAQNTEYTLQVMPIITDKSGKPMRQEFTYSFTTPSSSYAYLVRQYGDEIAADEHSIDSVMIRSVGSKPKAVFSKPEIRSFTANESYIVAVEKLDDKDVLHTLNRKTGKLREEKLPYDGRVTQLTLSPRGSHILYSVQLDYSKVTPEYYKEHTGKVQSLNLEDGTVTVLTNQQGIPLKASSIMLDRSGQVAMIQESFQAYYIVSPFNDFEPVLIGSHTSSAGFNSTGSEIVFRDTNDFFRYDVTNSNLQPLDLQTNDYVQTIRLADSALFYSSVLYRADEQVSSIYRMNNWDDTPKKIWDNERTGQMTLQTFQQSYDNNLLALQLNPADCSYDNFGSDSSCTTTRLHLYDTQNQKLIDDFYGINFVWLP